LTPTCKTMHFKLPEDAGGVQAVSPATTSKPVSSTLPFGQPVPISHISGPTYVTAQLLVQQIAYKLSDKIFSYSPDTFDLDVAAKDWADQKEKNIHGYATSVLPLQTRTGAGAFALGYIFSPDFDLSKRHVPQTLLATTGSLRHLRGSLDQLSLLYGVASPFVAHVAAADFAYHSGLSCEYDSALRIAEDLGLGLVSSFSTNETQHISLLATLLATLVPTLHVYDGIRITRETVRVADAMDETSIANVYNKASEEIASLNKRLDISGKIVEAFRIFNSELGTAYDLFEYSGHEAAEQVLVVFGSTEAQLATHVVGRLASQGAKIGVVKVRVYRPFVEEEFLKVLPPSVRNLIVVGQVTSEAAVSDVAAQSALYTDVLAAITFSDKFATEPAVTEVKYSASAVLSLAFFIELVRKFTTANVEDENLAPVPTHQYTFWDLDDSAVASVPTTLSKLFSRESTDNVYVHETYDNLIQGGIVRTDIRSSKQAIAAPHHISQADVAVVGDEKILKDIAISKTIKQDGILLVKLANFKSEDAEKRLPAHFRKEICDKDIDLYALDTSLAPGLEHDALSTRVLLELAFIKVARPDLSPDELAKFILAEGSQTSLQDWVSTVNVCLSKIDVIQSWTEIPEDAVKPTLREAVRPYAFVGFDKEESEKEPELSDWQTAA
jgi:sulfite reductase (NADPH) flavoprotein alpha-component